MREVPLERGSTHKCVLTLFRHAVLVTQFGLKGLTGRFPFKRLTTGRDLATEGLQIWAVTMTNALLGLVEGENRPMFWGNSCRDRAFPIAWQQDRRAGKGCHTSCVSFAGQARELHACHRPSENAGSERTTTTCSNNGAKHQNNACMKGFALSCSTEFLQENGHKRRVWRNGVWAELQPFNDRQLTRDLQVVCERVTAAQPHLPDGRRLCFTLAGKERLRSIGQRCQVASYSS